MQAVILCAGKGTRMGALTQDMPKPLLPVLGKNLLEYKLERLPKEVTEIILIIGYKGEKIRTLIGENYNGLPVTYVEDTKLTGTAHALWQAASLLKGRFLVMMGDDIYEKETLEEACAYDFSITGVRSSREEPGSRLVINELGELKGFATREEYISNHDEGGLICAGLYSLTPDIFSYEPVKIKDKDEWGLPHTLLLAAADHPVRIIETDSWISISDENDLKKAETLLQI